MKEEVIENDYAIFFVKNGVLHFIYKDDADIDLEAAKIIVADRVRAQKNTEYNVLCDVRKLKNVNKEARDYLADEGSALINHVAMLASSPAMKLMANFYLLVNRPTVPTKVFTSEEEALVYLTSK